MGKITLKPGTPLYALEERLVKKLINAGISDGHHYWIPKGQTIQIMGYLAGDIPFGNLSADEQGFIVEEGLVTEVVIVSESNRITVYPASQVDSDKPQTYFEYILSQFEGEDCDEIRQMASDEAEEKGWRVLSAD